MQCASGDGGDRTWPLVEGLLAEQGFELWIGDPAKSQAKRVRKQKTDRLDAELLLQLLLEDRFPRVWVPSPENRNLRQLLWHRHRLVQMRTRIMNQLQAVAMNEGVRRKKALWNKSGRSQLEPLPLAPWATRRRQDLLELLDRLKPTIEELSAAVEQEAKQRPEVLRLMTHPGVGPITALAFVLIIDSAERFACGKQIAGYVGLIPCETPAPIGGGWDILPSKATLCCASCWWRQRKQPYGATPTGDAGIPTWRCDANDGLPR